MARDVVERLRKLESQTKDATGDWRESPLDFNAFCVKRDALARDLFGLLVDLHALPDLLAVVEAAEDCDAAYEEYRKGGPLDDLLEALYRTRLALARLYAGSSGESD